MICSIYNMRLLLHVVIPVLIVAAGCGRSGESVADCDAKADAVLSYHDSALAAKVSGQAPEVYIELQQKAVDELRRLKPAGISGKVLSQMGYFLCRAGNYFDGLMYLQEAADSMRNIEGQETEAAKLLGNTSNLYCRIGMYDEALEYNRRAIEKCVGSNSSVLADLWRMRATIHSNGPNYDSIFICVDKALEYVDRIEDQELAEISRNRAENTSSYAIIEVPDLRPDDIREAIAVIEKNINLSPGPDTDSMYIGRGYFLCGERSRGLKIMHEAIKRKRDQSIEDRQWAMDILTQSIIADELSPRSLEIYNEAMILNDTINRRKTADALLNNDFKYRTSELRNEKLLLEAEHRLTRQRAVFLIVAVSAIILLAIAGAIRLIKDKNRKLRENKRAIEQLIDGRIELNRQIELLNEKLEKQYTASPGAEPAELPEQQIFSISILKKEDEDRFRQLFSSICPGLIERIRQHYPEISPSAELIFMLIRLKKSNSEIAFALSIKRESVAKARYRQRSLFDLDKETDLNDFIASL